MEEKFIFTQLEITNELIGIYNRKITVKSTIMSQYYDENLHQTIWLLSTNKTCENYAHSLHFCLWKMSLLESLHFYRNVNKIIMGNNTNKNM